MSHASHANAALTAKARLRLGRLVVEQEWTIAAAARRYEVDYKTAQRWSRRYAAVLAAGRAPQLEDMRDRSSRPHRCPTRTPRPLVRRIVRLRWRQRLGPVAIGHQLGMPASTVHAVLVRCRLNRLSHIDRVTGEPVRRYEHQRPGALLHVDVKKLGNIPDGGGWRYVGKQQGDRHRSATMAAKGMIRSHNHVMRLGTAFVHTVIDDHSRVAYAEIHDDEAAAAAIAVLRRAVAWATPAASPWNAYCPTTARPTAPAPGGRPAPSWASRPSAPGPTGRRPTARSSACTAPSPTAGPSPGCSSASQPADRPCRPGCTSTTITGPTPRSATARPSPA